MNNQVNNETGNLSEESVKLQMGYRFTVLAIIAILVLVVNEIIYGILKYSYLIPPEEVTKQFKRAANPLANLLEYCLVAFCAILAIVYLFYVFRFLRERTAEQYPNRSVRIEIFIYSLMWLCLGCYESHVLISLHDGLKHGFNVQGPIMHPGIFVIPIIMMNFGFLIDELYCNSVMTEKFNSPSAIIKSINWLTLAFIMVPIILFVMAYFSSERMSHTFSASLGKASPTSPVIIILCSILIILGVCSLRFKLFRFLYEPGEHRLLPELEYMKKQGPRPQIDPAMILFFIPLCITFWWFFKSGSLLLMSFFLPLSVAGMVWTRISMHWIDYGEKDIEKTTHANS